MRKKFRWREGNQVQLLVDGKQFFPVMLDKIGEARHSLLLEFYLITSGDVTGKILQALIDAASRGVSVKMIIDGFGSYRFSHTDRNRLETAGIELLIYNPLHIAKLTHNFARDHRKLLIVDQKSAFIGGTGLSDVYWLAEESGSPWHELMVYVQGPAVTDLVSMFSQLWSRYTGQVLTVDDDQDIQGTARIRVRTVQGIYQQDIKTSFVRRVEHSKNRVWFMTAYFFPSLSVRYALRKAAERGVDVSLITAGPHTDQPWVYHASKRYYRRLLKSGVKIYEYQPHCLHVKMAVVDEWSTLGSCNLDHWNLRWNLEANIEVDRGEFIETIAGVFQDDLNDCQEVTYAEWIRRPWLQRLKELVWALISQLVLKIK